MRDNTKDKIVLAALLHEIGKFYLRTDDGELRNSSDFKAVQDEVSGEVKGEYNLWTALFLRNHKSYFTFLLKDDFQRFNNSIIYPSTQEGADNWQFIIDTALSYSIGGQISEQYNEPQRDRLVSVFSNISKKEDSKEFFLPVSKLKIGEAYFPKTQKEVGGDNSYKSLWNDFEKEFSTIKSNCNSTSALVESLNALYSKYLVNVPSVIGEKTDISLYDQAKTTAGMASCIYEYLLEAKGSKTEIKNEEAPVLMIGGDLSGIQKYIYDIISKGAAKNLKGRSFYLYLLVDNIVRYILKFLDLYSLNVLYTSGGGFYLLAPNTNKIKEQLENLTNYFEEKIFRTHKTKLFLGISSTTVTQQVILEKEIGIAWKSLIQNINKTKRQKFAGQIINNFDSFFEPIEVGGKQLKDAITNEELNLEENLAALSNKKSNLIDKIEGAAVKKTTYDQIELGKRLKNVKWWVVSHERIETLEKYCFESCGIGVYNYLLSDQDLKKSNGKVTIANAKIIAFYLDDVSAAFDSFGGENNSVSHCFYGGNNFPKDEYGDPLTFDRLAEAGVGAQKLGILRMDIDNLGALFASGVKNSQQTFSKYAALSRNLDYFFKGYINHIWEDNEFKHSTYIIYSGGDDLFVVGFWSTLIAFSKRIRNDFSKWVCHNDALTLSGGVAIVPGKFPITKAAELSEIEEKLAKSHEYGGHVKNAFSVFHRPMNWDSEFSIVEDLKNELVELTEKNRLPKGILHKLIRYSQTASFQEENKLNPSWRWHMAYDFSRALGNTKDEKSKDFYNQIKMSSYLNKWDEASNHTYLDLLEVAARWAELETKK